MHELGLAQAILDIALDVAGPRPVRRVTVSVGSLQRVAPDSLEFGFRMLAERTSAETARLDLTPVPATIRCNVCATITDVDSGIPLCSQCGSSNVTAVTGGEVLVDEIELDDPPEVIRRPGPQVTEAPHHHQVGAGAS
jgi:hydrogenase nickel incorporation protein HypA/HybF